GKLFESKCDRCSREPFTSRDTYDEGRELPKCDCGGTLRVNVVWFGEPLPAVELERVFAELDRCTTFVAIGTSGVVEPVASFVRHVRSRRGRVNTTYIGPEPPANASYFDELMLGLATEMTPKLLDMHDVFRR